MIKFIKGVFQDRYPDIPDWDKPVDRMFNGKQIKGRPTKAYGSSDFKYAGRIYKPEPWSACMEEFKLKAEGLVLKKLGRTIDFNFCLCGYYGKDGMGIPHHSDTVPTLNDLVVSISFGSPRIFQWQEYQKEIKKETASSEINTKYIAKKLLVNYLMEDGDVFIFDGYSQMNSTHSVLDVKGGQERINLTFRTGI
tara:strand:- start:8138 stop:8719 length:582 start_codon:yes stop_codon:yes gene_type:complete